MSKYTSGEIQQVIDNLDYAQVFFPEDAPAGAEFAQVRRSLMNASDILTQISDDVIETLDKTRDVFEPVSGSVR